MTSFVENVGYNLKTIRGIPQNPTFDAEKYEYIMDNFDTNNGDAFITTYVKAGTTWTQQMIHLLLRDGEPGGFYSETIPWLEALSSDVLSEREAPTWTLERLNSTLGPRIFKSHATVDQLPRGLAEIKVIYVARNPKDTVVSLYHHAKSKPEFGYTGDFETFVHLFLVGQVENGSWFDHVLGWHRECLVGPSPPIYYADRNETNMPHIFFRPFATQTDPQTHLFLMYEDIYENPAIAVQLFADLLDLKRSDEVYMKVVKHSQLEEMRSTASIGMNHLRCGGIGGWRKHFTVALSEEFDAVSTFAVGVVLSYCDSVGLLLVMDCDCKLQRLFTR